MENYVFSQNALDILDGTVLPVVVYTADGVRKVIGEGTLKKVEDSAGLSLQAEISDLEVVGFLWGKKP